MASETASLLVELLLAATGVSAVLVQLLRRPVPPPAQATGRTGLLELALTTAGLGAAAVGPNILVVATSPGMPEMPELVRLALLPSLALILMVWGAAKVTHLPRLANRIAAGIWMGATASGALDAIRLSGFHLGLMPGNMPRMFGVMIFDRMAEGPTLGSDVVGYLYHYWVGACFGVTYALLAGRARWWGGLIWGLLIEIGMMVTPPMVIAMDTGYFGSKAGPGLFFVSLTAHVGFGIALGLLAERFVDHKGSIVSVAAERLRPASGPSHARAA